MSAKKAPLRHSPAQQAYMAQQHAFRQAGLELLSSLDCLQGVSSSELTRLIDQGIFRAFAAGSMIFGQQKQSRFLFLVISGSLQLHMRDKDGREVLMGVLSQGDCCGEGPLFGDFFRRTSALAISNCYLLQIPLGDLRESLPTLPLVATALRQVYKRRMLDCTLARIPLLGQLYPMERLALANLLKPTHIERGDIIIHQGDPADALYLIESGQVVVEQNGLVIATLGEGDFFGEMSLLMGRPHGANVRALTPTDILALPGSDFHHLIDQRPELETQLRVVVESRIRNGAALQDNQLLARELVLAVDNGLLRGSHLLVRTPSLCPPDCRICEQACATRYGQSRIQLNGTLIDDIDVLDTCRQCSVGAECVEACPEDAFERNEQGNLIITDRCTGCGACIEACPYDAITSVPIINQTAPAGPLAFLKRQARQLIQRDIIQLEQVSPRKRADKCDMCHHYEDRACLSACPTGSLRLVPVEELFPF